MANPTQSLSSRKPGLPHTPTTINNNNIVININKNYSNNGNPINKGGSKLKQVQEESFEEHLGEEGSSPTDNLGGNTRKSRMTKKLHGGVGPQNGY